MATSLPLVTLPPSKGWVDLYAVTGITPGLAITIQNVGRGIIKLSESATEPSGIGYNLIEPNKFMSLAASNVGAWALGVSSASRLQVEEA